MASRNGIHWLDTAASYGDSENVIGELRPLSDAFSVVTKTPQFGRTRIEVEDVRTLRETFDRSLKRLRCTQVYALLVHQAQDLLSDGGRNLFDEMSSLKAEGRVMKIGVSVYTPAQVEQVFERFPIDIVQVPINVLDQRLLTGGQLGLLKRHGIEIHARSVFLQGLLLMNVEELPAHFDSIRALLRAFQRTITAHGLDPLGACLQFVMNISEIDAVICGVNSAKELHEIVSRVRSVGSPGIDYTEFRVTDTRILHPTDWPLLRT